MTEQTQPTDAELLPCPFCEGRARMKTVASDWWKIVIDHAEDCVLSGHYVDAIVPQDDESKDWLIGRWNTRAKWGTPAGAGEPDAEVISTNGLEAEFTCEMLHGHVPALGALVCLAPPQPTQAQAGAVPNWQDISTAPKDGTRFVAVGQNYGLYSETQHTCIAQWFRGCWMEASDWNETSELKYLTHWMPLPPLERADRKQGGTQ